MLGLIKICIIKTLFSTDIGLSAPLCYVSSFSKLFGLGCSSFLSLNVFSCCSWQKLFVKMKWRIVVLINFALISQSVKGDFLQR